MLDMESVHILDNHNQRNMACDSISLLFDLQIDPNIFSLDFDDFRSLCIEDLQTICLSCLHDPTELNQDLDHNIYNSICLSPCQPSCLVMMSTMSCGILRPRNS